MKWHYQSTDFDEILHFSSELPDVIQCSDTDVCVVGIFGLSDSNKIKILPYNHVIGKTVFQAPLSGVQTNKDSDNTKCHIDSYYDQEERIVYLHLVSVYDVQTMITLCHRIQHNMSHSECHQLWKNEENQYARALLFMFTVCHVMLLNQPRCRFGLSFVQLFRALESTRQKLIPLLSDELGELGVSREWENTGRMCTPRLLLISQQCNLESEDVIADMEVDQRGSNKVKQRKLTPLQRLQHSTEDQIYRILRKSRILTNNISHCLFTLPANQPFVHIISKSRTTTNPLDFLIGQISHETNIGPSVNNYKYKRSSTKMSSVSVIDGVPKIQDDSLHPNSLKAFLSDHIKLVLTHKGFDDNISRSGSAPHFEVPRYSKWLEISSKLYDFFLGDGDDDRKQMTHFKSLQSALDLDMRFSEARCGKVLPLATRTYQENASSHYTSIVHNTKLDQALHVYIQHARGPAYEKYAEQLQEECELFWQNGRQLCEVISLTGHHCTHKLHLLPDDVVDPEIDARLPRRHHTNNNHTPAACNCGRTVVQRDDPFELKMANFQFFKDLEERCCGKLRHYVIKVFEPKRKDSKANLLADATIKESKKDGAQPPEVSVKVPEKKVFAAEQTGSMPAAFSPALSLGQSGAGTVETLSHDVTSGLPGNSSADMLSMADQITESIRDKLLVNELEGMSHLHGMLCSTSPRGLLPTFPSWSLMCLGKGGVYNPIKGLDQAGFLRDTNFLLPWDIPVPKGSTLDGRAWPSPSESGGGGRKGGKHRDKRGHKDSGAESGLRAYIGNEYECPRGHRFICSAPDKIVKATERSGVKESGTKLVTMDMPLYSPCACRSTKPPLGQLMRLFIVTPDTTLYIKLNPRVRPRAHPCPVFYPEPKGEGLTLPRHTMWVLRFPYVYVEESGPILPPTDNQPPPGAKLMKGVYLTTLKAPDT